MRSISNLRHLPELQASACRAPNSSQLQAMAQDLSEGGDAQFYRRGSFARLDFCEAPTMRIANRAAACGASWKGGKRSARYALLRVAPVTDAK